MALFCTNSFEYKLAMLNEQNIEWLRGFFLVCLSYAVDSRIYLIWDPCFQIVLVLLGMNHQTNTNFMVQI